MALQGTLETFSVPEVLRLLSGTRKTGLLALQGDRGAGNVWLADGQLVGARSDHEADGPVEAVLFDLLRYREGSFVFESDAIFDGAEPVDLDVEVALSAAEELLTEWHEIESVVPTLDVRLTMARALAGASVTISAAQWESLTAIGSGTTGRRLGAELGLGELDASRRIRDLAEAGLVEVDQAPEAHPVDLAHFVARDSDEEPVAPTAEVESPESTTADDVALVAADEIVPLDLDAFVAGDHQDDEDDEDEPSYEEQLTEAEEPWAASIDEDDHAPELADVDLVDDELAEDDLADESAIEPAPAAAALDDGEPDEFLSQLANLSPKAAAAIEATASTSETPGAAPELPSGDADEEINRNLLLKFLSSTKN